MNLMNLAQPKIKNRIAQRLGVVFICLSFPGVFLQVAKSYGDIYTVWFGPHPVVVLDGFQAVKDGLTTHPEDVVGRPVVPFFRALANNKGKAVCLTYVGTTGSCCSHSRIEGVALWF